MKVAMEVYGDAFRRVTIEIPRSFKLLTRRATEVLGAPCELWHAPQPQPPQSHSSKRIRSEAEFQALIHDDDVLILCDAEGRRLTDEQAASLFDTTYRRDYVAHDLPEYKNDEDDVIDTLPVPDIAGLTFATTHGQHYQPHELPRHPKLDAPPPKQRRVPPTGSSTYRDHYRQPDVEPHAATTGDVVQIPQPWVQSYESVAHRDFPPHDATVPCRLGHDAPDNPDPGPNVPWRPTEYIEEYVAKTAPPETNLDDPADFSIEGDRLTGANWVSMYNRDYQPPPPRGRERIHLEPELPHS